MVVLHTTHHTTLSKAHIADAALCLQCRRVKTKQWTRRVPYYQTLGHSTKLKLEVPAVALRGGSLEFPMGPQVYLSSTLKDYGLAGARNHELGIENEHGHGST